MDLTTDLESNKTKDLSDPRPRKNYQNIPNKTLPKRILQIAHFFTGSPDVLLVKLIYKQQSRICT